jgi:hypothetical protein
MLRSIICPVATDSGKARDSVPPIPFPLMNSREYEDVQVQVPIFFKRQTFVNFSDGKNTASSLTVTSSMNSTRLQLRSSVGVGVFVGVLLAVAVGVQVAVKVKVGVAEAVCVAVGDGVLVAVLVGV